MASFAWQPIRYLSLQDYAATLWPFKKPAFLSRVVIHHTYRPTQVDWQGRRTMDVLGRFYRAKGWPSGPHLFLAPDGIWGATPLAVPGTHAGVCNKDGIGLEIVGDFDRHTWDVGLRERVYSLVVLLLQWLGTTEAYLRGHRECLPNKSCPGTAIGMDLVRSDVQQRLFDRHFVVGVPAANIRLYPRANSLILGKALSGDVLPGHRVLGQAVNPGLPDWARVRLPDGRLGHIYAPLGRWEAV